MTSIQLIVDRQLRRWEAERLAALEAARAGRVAREAAPARPTVTVSRQAGLRGEAIAHALAARLGYELFDQQIIDYIATHHDVHRRMLELLDEHTTSSIKLWAEGIVHRQHVDQADFMRFLSKTVRGIHLHGGAVILGRGANFLLADARAFRVQLVAPLAERVKIHLAETGSDDEEAARREIIQVDAQRTDFIRRFYHADWVDPGAYDLSLNVAGLSVEGAAEVIAGAMGSFLAARWA
jgi:cytidylate kinase